MKKVLGVEKEKVLIFFLIGLLAVPALNPVFTSAQSGEVQVIWGPTPISEGEALSANDLTLMNEYLAVTFGIGTLPPWGVTRGHIIDLAPVVDGIPQADVIAQFSFPVNGWGNWATYEDISVVEETPQRAVVKTVGYWKDIRVEITYVLEAGKNYLYIVTNLTNTGTEAYTDLVSGYAISFKKGWTFTPGFGTGVHYSPDPKESVGAVEDWVSGYYEDFAVAVYAPYYTHLSTSTGWVDPYTIHTLNPGESKIFEGYLIVEPVGSTCKLLQDILQIKGEDWATLTGTVKSGDTPVPNPVVMIFQDGRPYCWAIGDENGQYQVALRPGTYEVQATGKGYGLSTKQQVTLTGTETATLDFTDVGVPGKVVFDVYDASTNQPVDAKITISGGEQPIVRYLSITTVYTLPDQIGHVEFDLPPGTYTFEVSHGGGFISKPVVLEDQVVNSGETTSYSVEIQNLIDPREYGYYSADLHHHSNYLDGRTPPEYVVVAQSAAGLDYAFVSDHDFVENHQAIASLASERGMPFIPSVEVSPNWAHFNPYPIPIGQYDIIRGTACEMLEAMRELGAITIRVNHPYTGYFNAWEKGEIPGGYCPDWDVAEVNGLWGRSDNRTVTKMWELWNMGERKYLTAGSDTHDIWATPYTGYPRVYAFISGKPTPEAFALAEKNGHSFITYGPLIFMNPLPGTTVPYQETIEVQLHLFAVDGLSRLVVYGNGMKVLDQSFEDNTTEKTLTITLSPADFFGDREFGWFQVAVWDKDNDLALTNPVWIEKGVVQATTTVTQTETTTRQVTLTQTQTETVTETTTQTVEKTSTVTQTSTETVTQQKTSWGATIGVGIILLIIGFAIAYTLPRRK